MTKERTGRAHRTPNKKNRPLTKILEGVGNTEIFDEMGKSLGTKAEQVSYLLWNLATTGRVVFPGQKEPTVASLRDWKDAVSWLYNHCEGPARSQIDVSTNSNAAITEMSDEELAATIAAMRSKGNTLDDDDADN